MDKQLSFIIPVYNGEQSIETCVDSITKQQSVDYEIIIIDDGSTDRTGEICDCIARLESRVTVIHTENQGQGRARNAGIGFASGRYIMFIDADDRVIWSGVNDMLMQISKKEYDIVCGAYTRMNHEVEEKIGTDISSGVVARTGSKEVEERYHRMKTSSGFGYLWNKLYRREFLTLCGVEIDDTKKVYMEDTIFNLKLLCFDPDLYYMNKPVYCYDITGESTTRRSHPDIVEKYLASIQSYVDFLIEQDKYDENLDVLVPLAMRIFCYSIVKNIPYEGLSYKRLRGRIELFIMNRVYQQLMRNKKTKKEIKKLRTITERIMYGFCWRGIKRSRQNILALFFTMLYPLFRIYINKQVK